MSTDDIFPKLQRVLDLFIHVITTIPPNQYNRHRPKIQIPTLSSDLFLPLLRVATDIFRSEPIILSIDHPVNVIGDLHGSLFDLMRFLHDFGLPPTQSYLFLGDFIDRGSFSTETIVLLLLLKVAFPQRIWLIRGNHEFDELCVPHTELLSELDGLYSNRTFITPLFEMFSFLPLAADISHYAFAVHGGLSPSLIGLNQIKEIERPITTFTPELVEDLLWSDPSENCPETLPSGRGLGVLFGINVVRKFLSKTGFQVIFRGHQSIESGVQMSLSYKVATVFSASNYCCDGDTQAGIVHVIAGPSYEKRMLPPLPIVERHNVLFVSSDAFGIKQGITKSVSVRSSSINDEKMNVLKRIVEGTPRRSVSQRMEPPKRRVSDMISPRRRTGRL
jgi:protein phosphatase